MNVCYCVDVKAYIGAELSIYSLLQHNPNNVRIYIHTMDYPQEQPDGTVRNYTGITEEQKDRLKKIVNRMGGRNTKICFIDTLDLYKKYLEGNANQYSGFTPYATLRLLFDKTIPFVDHCLYLDCDTAIEKPIYKFYDESINKLMGENKAWITSFVPDAFDGEGELVSGVMIMNLRKARDKNLLDKARRLLWEEVYTYPDQRALQLAEQPLPLPEEYAFMEDLFETDLEPAILHFTNRLSPKIYTAPKVEWFYKKYPQLDYVRKGLELI